MARGGRIPDVARKSSLEVELMREAGRVVAQVLAAMAEAVQPGVGMGQLDRLAESIIRKAGGVPSFKGYRGYPASICVAPDDVIVHGIPSDDVALSEGQVVGIDVGVELNGYHGDAATTLAVGKISADRQALLDATRDALYAGIDAARAGNELGELSRAVQQHVERLGYSVVRDLVGHGIGRSMHEPPQVPNYYAEGQFPEYRLRLRPGHALAIEPMVNKGHWATSLDGDGWTMRTADGEPSAHFEHTVIVSKDGPLIMTLP